MGKYKKYKNKIEKFLSSDRGQRFFNFAYSIGAAVVIWGALFKILHLPGGNFLLSLGMGTEVLMFILSAFDKPASSYHWEDVFPVLASRDPEERPDFGKGGGATIIGGINLSEADTQSLSDSIQKMSAAADQLSRMAELTDATQQYLSQLAAISSQMEQLRAATESLTQVSNTLLGSYQSITSHSDGLSEQSSGYVEQMEALNRNISGLNTIYEIQLKSISSQLDNIDRVNNGIKNISRMYESAMGDSDRYCKESEKMTQYIQQLNSVYEKMITAMTINMYRPMPGAPVEEPRKTDETPRTATTGNNEVNA